MKGKAKVSRPTSARTRPTNTLSSEEEPSIEIVTPRSSSKVLDRFENIKSYRKKPAQRPSSAAHTKEDKKTTSQSNFLRKFDKIREHRQPEAERPNLLDPQFEVKINNVSVKSSFMTSLAIGATRQKEIHSDHLSGPTVSMDDFRPRSGGVQYVSLRKMQPEELILPKQMKEGKELLAYWPAEGQYVSVIPLEKNEKVDFQHPNILPIHAQVTIKGARCVVTDRYRNCSLHSLLLEFGPLPEKLAKRYIRQVALGLQHMHYHSRAHNRLTTRAVFHNLNGQLYINTVKATSFVLSKEELARGELHYFSPEFLLAKKFSKGLKNDIWSLGCLALKVLGHQLPASDLHPYNWALFEDPREELQVDNLRKMGLSPFTRDQKEPKVPQAELSPLARAFVKACLQVLPEQRPSLESLLEYQFFEGV